MDVRWTDKWYIPLLIVYHRKEPDPIESPFNINQIETLMLSREPSISQCIVAPPQQKKINEFSLKLLQEILWIRKTKV